MTLDPDSPAKSDSSEPENDSFERLKFKRDCLWQEMTFRRERQWKIFGWASGFMLTVLGGFILLASRPGVEIPFLYRASLVAFTFLIFFFAMLRITHERSLVEHHAHQMWDGPYRELGIEPDRWAKLVHFGDLGFLLIVWLMLACVLLFGPTAQTPPADDKKSSNETNTQFLIPPPRLCASASNPLSSRPSFPSVPWWFTELQMCV